MSKISLATLKILLTPKEMKNITGGSSNCICGCNYGDGYFERNCACAGSAGDCIGYDPPGGCVIVSCE